MTCIMKGNAFKWNSVLRGFLESNAPIKVLLGYACMRRRGLNIDSHTLGFVIKACGLFMISVTGCEQVHSQVLKLGFESEVVIQTAVLKMYGTFGDFVSAQKVFDETPQRDVVLWSALVSLYAQRNHPYEAILGAHAMIAEDVRPNEVTVVSVASACCQLKALQQGKLLHAYAIKNLLGFDMILSNALIDMYAKCGCLSSARRLFGMIRSRNVITWTSMISGYCYNGFLHEAVAMFKEMQAVHVRADEVTMLGMVSTCAKMGDSELGNWVDQYIEKNGYMDSVCMVNALIDMHSKCGNIEKACQIFEEMKVRTLVSWTSMIQGLALHGHGVEALVRFSQMQREGFKPDKVVFLNVLNACSHAGLAMEGMQCFKSMIEEHGVDPWMEHYGSMVDLLCKVGLVKDAFDFIMSMPIKPDPVIWRALIRACQDQGEADLASQALSRLFELEPEHSGNYILKSNFLATIEEWDSVKEVRDDMAITRIAKRDPGFSSIEVNLNSVCS